MGCSKSRIPTPEERLEKAEKELLVYTGLEVDDFEIRNVFFDEELYLRTYQVGNVSTLLIPFRDLTPS